MVLIASEVLRESFVYLVVPNRMCHGCWVYWLSVGTWVFQVRVELEESSPLLLTGI